MVDADSVIHQLYQTTRAISKELNQRFESQGLFSSEWALVAILKKRGPMTQTALAGYLNIEPAAISKTLLRLEEKNLVQRETGASRREKIVSLSALAEQRYHVWEDLIAQHHRDLMDGLSEEDLGRLFALLARLFDNTQKALHARAGEA